MDKINTRIIIFIILTASVVLIYASCRTNRRGLIKIDPTTPTLLTGDSIHFDQTLFEWFDAKFNAEVNNSGKLNSLKGRVRIRRDSLIWISIKPDVAIIEVFRVLISPDSIKLINYLDKQYFYGNFSYIRSFMNVDVSFNMVQNIFTGNPSFFFPLNNYQVSLTHTDTVLSTSDLNAYLHLRNSSQKPQLLFHALWKNGQNQTWKSLYYDPSLKVETELRYNAYQTISNIVFPQSGQLTLISDTSNTVFSFQYTKTEINLPFEFPFNVPQSYSPMKQK
ncbi:MAG: DUF4292 domain-containing protein [Candidatus Competibacteraceae bacterium]|nr:DUF4292 domain-containing protein [Candidatus Competibacteraceae bacterium]